MSNISVIEHEDIRLRRNVGIRLFSDGGSHPRRTELWDFIIFAQVGFSPEESWCDKNLNLSRKKIDILFRSGLANFNPEGAK